MATVLVIDASVSVRETLRIVLGHEHDVVVGASLHLPAPPVPPSVVVLGLPAHPRDDRAIGAALTHLAPNVPVLLLHAPSDVDVRTLVRPHVPVEFLAKPFDAYAVRARIRALLAVRPAATAPTMGADVERRHLEFPFLAHGAAAVVRRALTADVPVTLLLGEPGTGAPAVARALHAASERQGTFMAVDAAALDAAELGRRLGTLPTTEPATIFLSQLDRASAVVQSDVLQLVETRVMAPASSLRLIVGARDDLGAMAAAGDFLPELAYAVTTLPIVLTPLRDRVDDLPVLVAAVTHELCARFRLPMVTFSAAALERLKHYLWFGNVAELHAVLARTLVLTQTDVVEADQLVFLAEDVPRALMGRTAVAAPTLRPVGPLASLDLEVVLGELAHELRNPMVTIKTFAQHLDSVLEDPEERARFSTLTAEAVGRMDDLLETLLEFSRFRAPERRPVDPEALLDRALAEQAPELARRQVNVERNGVGVGFVDADEAQVSFAFRCLCRGLVADLAPHAPIKIRGAAPGAVELEVRTEPSTAARLAAWVEPLASGAAETPPLAWALAAALLDRNGGALSVHRGETGSTVIRIGWTQRAA